MMWDAYQARMVDSKVRGEENTPDVEEAIMTALQSFPSGCKREELCSQVAATTGIYFDEVANHISHYLKQMKKRGKIVSPIRGYWRIA